MDYPTMISMLVLVLLKLAMGTELTFELPDNEHQCFFEKIDKGTKCTLEFQVITGGQYDVDMELMAPNGQILYKDVKKQYDSFTWTTDLGGIYKFCFSNEFSTFSHKVVYFDLEVGEEKPILEDSNAHATAMTLMDTYAYSVHETLQSISSQQNHFKLRETTGRVFAESLHHGVAMWSIGQTVVILLIGIGQVFVLRSFFTDRKSSMNVTS